MIPSHTPKLLQVRQAWTKKVNKEMSKHSKLVMTHMSIHVQYIMYMYTRYRLILILIQQTQMTNSEPMQCSLARLPSKPVWQVFHNHDRTALVPTQCYASSISLYNGSMYIRDGHIALINNVLAQLGPCSGIPVLPEQGPNWAQNIVKKCYGTISDVHPTIVKKN